MSALAKTKEKKARAAPTLVTFGCRLNTFESEAIRRLAAAAGLTEAVIVNTCAVTTEAERQARQAIRKARREHPEAPVIVTGCAAQVNAGAFAAMPEADAVIGNAEKLDPAVWKRLARHEKGLHAVSDIMARTEVTPARLPGFAGRTRAFVQVQTGCDHRCTFCIIPYGRGNARSLPLADVIDQVKAHVAAGHREVVITGVDITSWGEDLGGAQRLGHLVAAILKRVPGLQRLRVSSIDVAEIDDEFLRVFASEERLMPHLHLSLQAGDDMILKRMKRRHRRQQAIDFCATVRDLRPAVTFGADLIAGFPTETEEMFANTRSMIGEIGIPFLHVFPYSARPGTPAARMPQVAGDVIRARAARLREEGAACMRAHLQAQRGKVAAVHIERPGFARAEDNTPVGVPGDWPVGDIRPARITAHDDQRLIGEAA